MEKFFNFSITTFRNSISSALPYILVYSLTNILISFFIQFPELNEDLESSMGSFDEKSIYIFSNYFFIKKHL